MNFSLAFCHQSVIFHCSNPAGEKLVHRPGFEKIVGKRDAYMLIDLKKATKPIVSFIERMEQKKKMP